MYMDVEEVIRFGIEVKTVADAYLCPICQTNRTRFALIYKFVQEVQLDPHTGRVVYEANELESPLRPDGRLDIDVRCLECDYVGSEMTFIKTRQREAKLAKRARDSRPAASS